MIDVILRLLKLSYLVTLKVTVVFIKAIVTSIRNYVLQKLVKLGNWAQTKLNEE